MVILRFFDLVNRYTSMLRLNFVCALRESTVSDTRGKTRIRTVSSIQYAGHTIENFII